MMNTLKKLLKSKEGYAIPLFIGFAFLLLMIAFLIMDFGGTLELHDYGISVLQRCCNSAVEKNIKDEYRADHILELDLDGAKSDFASFVANDLSGKYHVDITEITGSERPPVMTVKGKITFETLFSKYGFGEMTVDFTVRSTNYDLDDIEG